jgi:hypothetical protein
MNDPRIDIIRYNLNELIKERVIKLLTDILVDINDLDRIKSVQITLKVKDNLVLPHIEQFHLFGHKEEDIEIQEVNLHVISLANKGFLGHLVLAYMNVGYWGYPAKHYFCKL